MKTILLTGASGFVGTNFILELHKKFHIIALVRKNSDISLIKNKCEIIRHSDDFQALNHIFTAHKINGVIHLATKWTSNHTPSDIKSIIDTNILFGTQILEVIKVHRIPFFINASSFGMFCNSNSYRPATLYAASKRAFEDIMRYYSLVAKSTIFCNLLIFNTFGSHDKTTRLFNLLDNIAINDGALDMSDGMQIVDYTHIKNIVWGFECLIDLIAKRPKFCKNKLFTLQSKNRQTLRELVELYEKLLGKKLQINWGKRAKRELEITKPFSAGIKLPNWSEKISLKDGLKDLINANKFLANIAESGENIAESALDSAIYAKNRKNCNFENPSRGGAERDESRIIIAKLAESTPICHSERKRIIQKNPFVILSEAKYLKISQNRDSSFRTSCFTQNDNVGLDSSVASLPQNDNLRKFAESGVILCVDAANCCYQVAESSENNAESAPQKAAT